MRMFGVVGSVLVLPVVSAGRCRRGRSGPLSVGSVLFGLALGCNVDVRSDALDGPATATDAVASGESSTSTGPFETSSGAGVDDGVTSDEPGDDSSVNFDVGTFPDFGDVSECTAPSPTSCDAQDDDPWHALGLNCDGGPQVDGVFFGDAQQIYVHEGEFGSSGEFPPREGDKVVFLSTGVAEQMVTAVDGLLSGLLSNPFGATGLGDLPAPMTKLPVTMAGGDTCEDQPGLVGTGDCSNTILEQYEQGGDAFDLAYLSFSAEVPGGTYGFTYDFAFFSVEYPVYYQSMFNDMYVAWLESEEWTGNVSFDEFGAPISLNAGFLDFKDAANPVDCPAPCEAPELAGTGAQGHAGTRWLSTSAPVVPGETIEVYFAIFDLTDGGLDSAVMLDNFLWTCDGGPPVTIPG